MPTADAQLVFSSLMKGYPERLSVNILRRPDSSSPAHWRGFHRMLYSVAIRLLNSIVARETLHIVFPTKCREKTALQLLCFRHTCTTPPGVLQTSRLK